MKGIVRAHLAEDAPFAVAIGASILVSLAFPVRNDPDEGTEDDDFGGIDFTDTRFGVMGILSVIPYFNWMSWIFAWLDTGRQRYLVYSIVTNLSISPDDSWLPIFSILACIFHVQLEASIRNGDINGIPLLDKAVKYLFPAKKKDADDTWRRCNFLPPLYLLHELSRYGLAGSEALKRLVDHLRHPNN
ncbi:unnamed protein product [Spirodela intermedia]|uniref:Uncharacterized protein n=1 Tax=Spirodela intermedia TaxID=51605 RepID=A0A7I8J1S3_SPIIN|nr:unnamed protein product [Spirodela intermedia]CAA6663341.1 unnamed protein product [Spirodela intermedia]